jgi:YfiH family protein|tara:strand:+ start:1302 stop:2054 length:753 start_codon:yes stop_codon:yes gene_type:complete
MFKSKLLNKFDEIEHGFFNSKGGFSKGIYESLNCGIGSKDLKKNVVRNLEKVAKQINTTKQNIILLNQVHSNKVINVRDIFKIRRIGDGLITNRKKLALGILTADCAPILIFDPKKKIIAALHAGWKGAFKDIIGKTINKLNQKGSKSKDLIAVVGPCISIKNYEVKKDFLNKFLQKSKKNIKFFKLYNKKIFFSLNSYIKSQLINMKVKKIEIIHKNTFPKKNNFFSSRRSIKNKFNDYGRNISIIMIK